MESKPLKVLICIYADSLGVNAGLMCEYNVLHFFSWKLFSSSVLLSKQKHHTESTSKST